LTRKNQLRTILSLDIAFKTNQWVASKELENKSLEKRVLVDISTLINRLELIESYEMLARDRFKDREILEITYEDLIANPEHTFQKVGKYLHIGNIDPSQITLKKQNPEPIEKLIINYSEVSNLLKGTRFHKYLEII
jgi:LPS sulfotransferase NodH